MYLRNLESTMKNFEKIVKMKEGGGNRKERNE